MNINDKLSLHSGLILELLDEASWTYKRIGNKYMGPCPSCHKGFRTPNTVFNIDTNSFKCFACGESGGLKKLAELLNIDFKEFLIDKGIIETQDKSIKKKKQKKKEPVKAKIIITPKPEEEKPDISQQDLVEIGQPLSEEMKEYLRKRRIDPTIAKEYIIEIKDQLPPKYKLLNYYKQKGYKMIIPFFDKDMNLISMKLRVIENKEDVTKSIIYKGFKKALLGINQARETEITILTEGEIDFLSLKTIESKYPKVFKNISILGCPDAHYIPKEEELQYINNIVIIMLDSDETGLKGAVKLKEFLTSKGKKALGVQMRKAKDINDIITETGERLILNYIQYLKEKVKTM